MTVSRYQLQVLKKTFPLKKLPFLRYSNFEITQIGPFKVLYRTGVV